MPATNPHEVMNGAIHHGLRRDLDRTEAVLSGAVTDEQRLELCRHLTWMLDYLHHHHVGEDEGVWPRTVAKRPDLQPLLAEMEAEHRALSAASDEVRAAAAVYASDGSEAHREALADAVRTMKATTLPHLEHEERETMPLVVQTLDEEDWAYLDKHYFRKGVSLGDLGVMGAWLVDDLDAERAAAVRGMIPKPLMLFLTWRYGSAYDRAASTRWGSLAGTRA